MSRDQETCATPVFLLSGFLGSGKTTLITRVLDTERIDASKQAQTAVIVNEYGAVGLDHRMMAEARDDIVDVSGGCFCCSASTPLIETLEKILKKEPRQIIIETSGEKVSAGDLDDTTFNTVRKDEIGRLALSFERMQRSIREKIQTIKKQNEELESNIQIIQKQNVDVKNGYWPPQWTSNQNIR